MVLYNCTLYSLITDYFARLLRRRMEQTPKLGSYEEWEAWMVASSLEGKNDQASSSVEDGIKNFMKEDDPQTRVGF